MRIAVTLARASEETDVLVDCDDATPLEEIERTLALEIGADERWDVIRGDGADPDGSVLTAASAGLRHGARIHFGRGATRTELPPSGLQLHVVGGLQAGLVIALPQGSHELGRGAAIAWDDRSLSRRNTRITVTDDEITVTDLGSTNGTFLEGVRLDPDVETPWALGELLEVGDSAIMIRPARHDETVVEDAEPGWRTFLRPPRIKPYHLTPVVEVPRAPEENRRRGFPVIAALAPLVLGLVMVMITKSPTFLIFCLMSPVMLGANYITERRGGAKNYKEKLADYHAKLETAQERLVTHTTAEQGRLRSEMPDAAETFVTATLPGNRLWERRRHDDDFLTVRLGTSNLPTTIEISGEVPEDPPVLHSVPVGFSITESHVVGIAGPDEQVDAVLRWSIVQLAAYHAPRDLTMSFLTSRGGAEWSWISWLPHLRPDDPDGPPAMIGNDTETQTAQVAWLNATIKARRDASKNQRVTAESFAAHVVVLHGYRGLRAVPGLAQALEEGPAVGVYALCVDDHQRSLPERAVATLSVDPVDLHRAALRRSGHPAVPDLLLDGVSVRWADEAARSVASLRDLGGAEDGESLPDSARLLDVLEIDPPTADKIRSGWIVQPMSTTMVLGAGLGGPFSLDLRTDGPHGLIAGMTGSGKTELLQTMIASLAVANRPDAINFVLVDYKGDSAFKDCVKLPHTVGKVNDLDPHLVVRALESLKAELKYREHFLAEAGTKDIEDYQALQAKESHRPPLPRLLLVIDEFAQLSKDLPDFVKGLVSIAQLGRSLGIHLLLATQRPSGVVSAEIRANTNMRIALRVADAADSTDVLDTPDASRIAKSTPGRAYARLGAGALQAFQSGRVGGRRPGAVAIDLPPPFVSRVTWRSLGYAAPRPPARKETEVAGTDLSELVSAIVDAARDEQVPAQRSPWLPPIPLELQWSEEVQGESTRGRVPAFPFGRRDVPDQQRQVVADLDLERDGHLLVVGSAGSGRSQLLRTIAASVTRLADPSDVHLYGVDCGNGALNVLTSLPHTGTVVSRSEGQRATRLLARLGEELDRRQQILSSDGFADITEQRRVSEEPLPHIVLMLDRWEGFTATLGTVDALNDVVMRVLREGASLGVHAIITGDRSLAYNSRVSSTTENKLTLRLADRDDYGLVGLRPKDMPDTVPPGRGFTRGGNETQIYLLDSDLGGQAQAAALRRIGEDAAGRVGTVAVPPFRVDALPARIEVEAALQLVPADAPKPYIVAGIGGDELTAYAIDHTRSTSFIVAGPGRSGRSSVLLGMARSVLASGGSVIAVAPRPSPLRDLDGPGVLAVITDPATPAATFDELVESAGGPVVVLIDDGEGLRDAAGGDFFLRVARGQVPDAFVVLGGHAEGVGAGLSGWQPEMKKARQGLLLSPQGMSDGDLVGTRVPRNLLGQPVAVGRGWIHLGDGSLTQVATIAPPR
jgi:S-DNA-T family DNA segregation ATPase FtsK/SpoIIIE